MPVPDTALRRHFGAGEPGDTIPWVRHGRGKRDRAAMGIIPIRAEFRSMRERLAARRTAERAGMPAARRIFFRSSRIVIMNTWEALYGPNVGYALELYEHYREDPDSVDPATRAFFEKIGPDGDPGQAIATLARPASPTPGTNGTGNGSVDGGAAVLSPSVEPTEVSERPHMRIETPEVHRIVVAARLARGIREYGHLAASIDPLGTPGPGDPMLDAATHGITDADLAELPASIVWPDAGPEAGSCLDAIIRLREIYSGSVGYDFDHVQDFEERAWLHNHVERGTFRQPLDPEERRALLRRLTEVDGFEQFLHTAFQGQKRFSIEGNDALVPMLDQLVHDAEDSETREMLVGMAHRGRLNVLAHILQKPYEAIFSEFHSPAVKRPDQSTAVPESGWTGDVKYHLGAQWTIPDGEQGGIVLTLADNPSHLEFVNPVVEGFARAAQDCRRERGAPTQNIEAALPVTIHGDAAFPGEGVVAETLNLSRLEGYQTGGTIRFIVNNQIGFTTSSGAGRSTLYASDLAKGFEIPVIHVNADDVEACIGITRLAHAYREQFHKDVLIDLVGYRRWGHNEGDEPVYTHPSLYARIKEHPRARELYRDRLINEGVVTAEEAQRKEDEVRNRLREARDRAAEPKEEERKPESQSVSQSTTPADTGVSLEELRELNQALLRWPEGFQPHPRLERQLARRREALEQDRGIDWAHAETLAFASILADGTPIRLTGQDTERGTFSQRHLVLHDPNTGMRHVPLQALPQARASFAVYNSPLTESAVLGFEYGYSVHAPEALVLWEAQFGDFANAGQVLIDQFLVSARAKWRRQPSLVLLLPHGYEGQGPEHSSARLERFLQLAAEDNLRVANCSTAAQYFHLLRLQVRLLESDSRPLVMMTPKSLLRQPLAASGAHDLADGRFHAVIGDADTAGPRESVRRLVLCSGKVAIDLTTTAKTRPERLDWVAVARVELLYPFPQPELRAVISAYPNLSEVVWLQEEPQNMGAWIYMAPRLESILPDGVPLRYIGRSERASTAEGSSEAHAREQSRIVESAFGGERLVQIDTIGVHDVS